MSHSSSIVIVGARVAGATTAIHLARMGHDVTLIDRTSPDRDVVSTHLLMRAGVHQLQRIGATGRLAASGTPFQRSMTLGFGDQVFEFAVRERFGVSEFCAPRRPVLDTLLLDMAREAGADVRLGCTVTGVTRDRRGRVSGVAVSGAGGDETIEARFVVGADGVRSTIARHVDAQTLFHHPSDGSVIYSYFDLGGPDVFDFRYLSGWNAGLAATNDGMTLVYVAMPHHALGADTEATFRRGVLASIPDHADAVLSADRVERFRRSTGVPTVLRRPAGPGWFLVGDAGFSKDPATAHGLTSAMTDAQLTADAIHEALGSPVRESDAASRFWAHRDSFAWPLIRHGVGLGSFAWSDPAVASEHMRALGAINDDECAFFEGDTELAEVA